MQYLKLIFLPLLIAPAPALAQDHDNIVLTNWPRDTHITVVATGSETVLDRTGQSIGIVGREEIEAVQGPDLTRVLERLPGVTLTRNGGLGSFTGIRVRGAGAEQLLVLLDGVRVADVAAPGGGYDFGNLTSGPVGKIELLRGSNSVIWGSDAVGGVLAITSRDIEGIEAQAEYGAHDSFDGEVNGGLSGDAYTLALDTGFTRTGGISSAASGSEPDGFRQWRLGGRGRVRLGSGLGASVRARHADSRLDMDGFPPPTFGFADTPEFQKTRELSGRAGIDYFDSQFELQAGLAMSDARRRYYDPTFGSAPGYATRGRSERAELKGEWRLAQGWKLDFGADHEWSRFSSTFDERKSARMASAHALLAWSHEGVNLAAGLRLDDHSRFGSEATFGANGSVWLGGGWRLRASYGEGFKAPTLYQLHSDFGNAALPHERGGSYDAGIEQGDRNGDFHAALTLFRRDTRGLIDFVSCFSSSDPLCGDGRFGFYANVGRARAEGFELELGAEVSPHFRAQAAYSYVKTTNRTPGHFTKGNDLARRPRHAVTVALDWETPLAGLQIGADLRFVSESYDDAGNFTPIEPYALGTLRASLPVSEAIELFGRIENVTDEDYQTAAGYGTTGRSAYLGARTRF